MSITLTFESDYFAEHINDFENARRIYAGATSKIRRTLKLPSKVNSREFLYHSIYKLIQVQTAVFNSIQVKNANILLSKKDCSDSSLKKEIDCSKVNQLSAIKKFLIDGSQTLNLQFVEKRVTRKRSGIIT